jgi:hypothetical protein
METGKGVSLLVVVSDGEIRWLWLLQVDPLTIERFDPIKEEGVAIKVKGSGSYIFGLEGGLQHDCSILGSDP